MAASRTAKKQNNHSKTEVDRYISAAAQYISTWTQREFNSISKNTQLPLIWPIDTGGYVINRHRITPHNGYWELHNDHRELVHTFDSKQSAIFYSLCSQVKAHRLADEIRNSDGVVLKLKNDVVHYHNSVERAIKKQDSNGIHVWSARLDDAKLRLGLAQKQLQKSIKSAKYLKVWSS